MSNIHCYPKLKSKVIVPSRSQLLKLLESIQTQTVDFMFKPDEMIDHLSFHISQLLRVNVYHSVSYKCPIETIIPSAEYFSDLDSKKLTPIHLTLISNPNSKIYIWDQMYCRLFFQLLADTIIHEMVHMRNNRLRNFQTYFNFDYDDEMIILSDPDCIDAYAHNIADDLSNTPNALKIIKNPTLVTVNESLALWNYITTFSKDVSHPVIKKLMKKVFKLLKQRLK